MKQEHTPLSVLNNWVHFDVAMHAVGRELGLVPKHIKDVSDAKAVFWSNNPVGMALHAVPLQLVATGYLLHDQEENRFKLNEAFDFEKVAFDKSNRK